MITAKFQWSAFISAALIAAQVLPACAQSYARDMFYQQLKDPGTTATSHPHQGHVSQTHSSAPVPAHTSSNTGLAFWIELHRGNKTSKVDSRTHFKGGDRIKFHVTPNVSGYAHVVMLEGSSGKQSVLFPVAGKDPTNQVSRGHEYEIPKVTFLVFDNTPGREHVRIALTRSEVDTSKFLTPQGSSQLAMATISPNVAIDPTAGKSQIKVSFKEDIPAPVPVVVNHPAVAASVPPREQPISQPTNDAPIANAIPDDDNAKDMYREDSVAGGSASHPAHHVVHHAYRPVHRVAHHYVATPYRPAYTTTVTPPAPPPTTVVLNTNANEDLYADISLEHD